MKRALSFLLILVLLSVGLVCQVSANPFPVSYTTYDTTYDAILKMYIRVINAGGDEGRRHDLFNTKVMVFDMDLSWLNDAPKAERDKAISSAKNSHGYRIFDLNGDGIDELAIGNNNGEILELFTMDNGRVRELVHAWYKKECHLLEDGKIHSYTHGDGSFVQDTVWKMNGTGDLVFVEGYQYDYNVDSFARNGINPDVEDDRLWFRMRNGDDKVSSDDTLITVEEYYNWHDSLRTVNPGFITFAAYEMGVDYVNAGIISVRGKTDGREKVNVRSKASKNSGIVTTLSTGTFVNILGEEGDFYKISFSKKEGYVHKDFLIKQEDTYPEAGDNSGFGTGSYSGDLTGIPDSGTQTMKPTLRLGSEGDEVKSLQSRLMTLGYYTGEIDGKYSEAVATAVIQFQQINGLKADGIVGKQTDAVLHSPQAKPYSSESDSIGGDDQAEYELVIDHYEEVQVQRSREVYDHDEYTMVDNGDGTYREVSHPVYRTEYYYETVQQPVYRQELRKKGE